MRFLQDYVAEFGFSPATDPDAPLVMWLDAQSQTEREERIRRLQTLVNRAPPDNHYSQMARAYLYEEERLGHRAKAGRSGISIWQGALAVLVVGLLLFGAAALLNPPAPPAINTTATITISPTALSLPDRSQALVADSFTARYPRGILQITAIEADSERVIDNRSQTMATPVPGARFYALSVVFECRGGICDHPPEVNVALQLDNGDLIAPKTEASIIGQPALQPVALGRTTAGWLVFEVPLVSPVKALVVSPPDPTAEGAFEPIIITLGIS